MQYNWRGRWCQEKSSKVNTLFLAPPSKGSLQECLSEVKKSVSEACCELPFRHSFLYLTLFYEGCCELPFRHSFLATLFYLRRQMYAAASRNTPSYCCTYI